MSAQQVPSRFVHPVYAIVKDEYATSPYDPDCEYRGTTDDIQDGAQIVASRIDGTYDFWTGESEHTIMLDLDVPAALVPSSTPGHNHLYIDVKVPQHKYMRLLEMLAEIGVIEDGYWKAAERRGFTGLRLPWVKKAA